MLAAAREVNCRRAFFASEAASDVRGRSIVDDGGNTIQEYTVPDA
jgi:hypothetical protein